MILGPRVVLGPKELPGAATPHGEAERAPRGRRPGRRVQGWAGRAPRGVEKRTEKQRMIEVESLSKRYGRATAVDGISFRVEKGEILGFLGPNGAGKTTTMRILTGYLPATDGTARVAGFDVFDDPLEVKRHVGYIPETPPLYPD